MLQYAHLGLDKDRARGGRPRLAIVSTFDELCGIAGYTRNLVKQLEGHFDIEVFDLDQFFMRSRNPNVRRAADQIIHDFCARAQKFDFVNIQLEYGTIGSERSDIIRRLRWIARSAPALSVTFHTVLSLEPRLLARVVAHLSRLRLGSAINTLRQQYMTWRLQVDLYALLRQTQRQKPVNVIVHTRRDMRLMRYVHRLSSVVDHPLAFITADEAQRLRTETNRAQFPALAKLPPGIKLIGIFGFLTEYKGFEVVVRAMHLLPEDYHLAIFGSVHPNDIVRRQPISPYVGNILDEAYAGHTIFDSMKDKSVSLALDSSSMGVFAQHPKDIASRLHFLGAQTDEGFARGMAVCDAVVLPYLEVGQSSSGVLSLAVEMGARVIAARNQAFLQFARYNPDVLELFDIGNFVELAEKILSPMTASARRQPLAFNTDTNKAVYVVANTRLAKDVSGTVPVEPQRVLEPDR